MTFDEALEQVRELLQSKGRMAYRALKRRFDLDDEYLEDLKAELIDAEHVARDEDGKVLVWIGPLEEGETAKRGNGEREKSSTAVESSRLPIASPQHPAPNTQHPAERRQLTVMFCDLVGSTALSAQLDPEELREVVRAYQDTCTEVIRRYDGHVAQHLGDGLLVYFGYPVAHEDDAQRAVRAGLGIVETLRTRGLSPLSAQTVQVRIGIHTGQVVVGEIGSSDKREMLALGETPNLAARIQGIAAPNEVVISVATYRLVHGLFEHQDLGPQVLKGITTPLALYRIVWESDIQSRFEVTVNTGLTPLVGRDLEVGLLQERWAQAKDGAGQVVLLSGEAGIGKSRLVQALKEQVMVEGATCIEFHCSPYHQNSAFYPIIEHLQRLLQFGREESPQAKLEKLHQALARYHFPQADTASLLAALLSLPHPEDTPPLTLSPQKQKQKTQEALVAWIVEETERQVVYCAWEDLHWADPSTLELLTLFLDQVPTARLLAVLTFRPDFTPPWRSRSHITQLTLNRLGSRQVREMVSNVATQAVRASTSSARTDNSSPSDSDSVRPELVEGRIALSDDLIDAVIARTDGVPLFVEELTKSVVETMREQGTGNGGQEGKFVGTQHTVLVPALGIPATLQDALMARLDRLGLAKDLAQLGSVLGREFSYDLLRAVSSLNEEALQQGLRQLVEAELLYQRGLPPQANYLFKHALVQETAYQSLLKSRRQQLHQQVAQMLEEKFPQTVDTQPELPAHHYTEAGLIAQAIPYWQRAGQRAAQRSAHIEAINYLTKGLERLEALPDTPECAQQELTLQITLGLSLIATKGFAAPEVEKAYIRAQELSRQVGETPELFPVLRGLAAFYGVRGELRMSYKLSEQFFSLAQSVQDPAHLVEAYYMLGVKLFAFGELTSAREHFEQGIAFYDPQKHRSLAFLYGHDPGMACLSFTAHTLWLLGYPDQALKRMEEALSWAQELSYPYNLAGALCHAAQLHQYRREGQAAQEQAEAALALATEQGFALVLACGKIWRGWALAEQSQGEEGTSQIRQGLDALWAIGVKLWRPYYLVLLAEAYGKAGQAEEGLSALAEALAWVDKTGERVYEAELYRLKGELLLTQEGQLRD